MLRISASVVREALEEYAHELVIFEDAATLQSTFDQLNSVLLDAESILA